MKKIFHSSLIILLLLGFSRCKKSLNPIVNLPANNAKIIGIMKDKFESINSGSHTGTKFDSVTKYFLWDSAKYAELTIGKSVIVPIQFEGNWNIRFTQNGTASVTTTANRVYNLLLYVDNRNEFHEKILSILPDLINTSQNSIIFQQDWNGSLNEQFYFSNGKAATLDVLPGSKISTESVAKPQIQIPADPGPSTYTYTMCNYIEWYNCNDPSDCVFTGTSNEVCYTSTFYGGGANSSTMVTNPDFSYYMHSSGMPPTKGPFSNGTYASICNPQRPGNSYTFSTIGNSWYMSFNNIGLSLVYGGIPGSYNYFFASPCFQISQYSCPTQLDATVAINQAWNWALVQTTQLVNANNYIGELFIKTNMTKFIQQYLSSNFPGSTFNGYGCGSNVPSNKPTYCGTIQ